MDICVYQGRHKYKIKNFLPLKISGGNAANLDICVGLQLGAKSIPKFINPVFATDFSAAKSIFYHVGICINFHFDVNSKIKKGSLPLWRELFRLKFHFYQARPCVSLIFAANICSAFGANVCDSFLTTSNKIPPLMVFSLPQML